MEHFKLFQVYGSNQGVDLNILVDRIWISKDRIYFRILKKIHINNQLRKEKAPKIYSIDQNEIFSMRCKLYF